jgi:hypothetical protein
MRYALLVVALAALSSLAACPTKTVMSTGKPPLGGLSDAGTVDAGTIDSPYTPMAPKGGAPCLFHADCDDGVFCNGDELCIPSDARSNRLGCVRPLPIRCLPGREDCNEGAQVCEIHCAHPDADGDGHRSTSCGGDDCDDNDASRYPGNAEFCDSAGHDDDCDPMTLGPMRDNYGDLDHDGFVSTACCNTQPDGSLLCGSDCDDTRPTVNAAAVESCNGFDDNCDGMIDNGVTQRMYVDHDGDGWGTGAASDQCPGTAGYATVAGDCNDDVSAVSPGQVEVCNGIDDDCDGMVDEGLIVTLYPDADEDGYGAPASSMKGCPGTEGYSELGDDCDDTNPAIVPGTIVCVGGQASPNQIKTCESVAVDGGVPAGGTGTFATGSCAGSQACHAQPNGTGVCF